MKTLRRLTSKVLCEFDMFVVEPTLRYKQEPFSSTSGLGCLSLLIYGILIWLFVKNLVEVINMNTDRIKIMETSHKSFENVLQLNNFMFGVQIPPQFIFPQLNRTTNNQKYNLTELQTYFTIEVNIIPYGQVDYLRQQLKPCDPEDWKQLGQDYKKQFQQNQLYNSFCPVSPLNFSTIAVQSNFLLILVRACINESEEISYCKDKSQIDEYKRKVINKYGYFPLWIDYLVSVPQVGEVEPLKYIVDSKKFSASATLAYIGTVGFDRFEIQTDKSIWPFGHSIQQVYGLHTSQTFHAYFQTNVTVKDDINYIVVYSYIRPTVTLYKRKMTKINNVISYVGGLLAIILSILSFFLKNYNSYRCELKVGQNSFNYYSDGQLIKQKNLNPWVYIKYTVWDWISFLTGHQMNWKTCIEMDNTRQQVNLTMDVQKLFRRLQFLERIIMKGQHQHMLQCLTLIEPSSIADFRRKRKMLEYYQEIVRLEKSPCVKNVMNDIEQKKDQQKLLEFILHSSVKSIMNIEINQSQNKKEDKQIESENRLKINQQQESQEQISQSLMYDLGLQHEVDICQRIAKYQVIAYQAKQMKIDPDFDDIEKQMTQSFLALTPERKSQMILNMPIKILHRLRYKSKELKIDEGQFMGLKQLFMEVNMIISDKNKDKRQ